MGRRIREVCLKLLVAASLSLLPGCFGVSQNPSYFPHLLPTGDIIRTHAKPPGPSYFSNFDPHAARLEVRPLESTNPVRTQHVLIATIYDEKGNPRRNRRVRCRKRRQRPRRDPGNGRTNREFRWHAVARGRGSRRVGTYSRGLGGIDGLE